MTKMSAAWQFTLTTLYKQFATVHSEVFLSVLEERAGITYVDGVFFEQGVPMPKEDKARLYMSPVFDKGVAEVLDSQHLQPVRERMYSQSREGLQESAQPKEGPKEPERPRPTLADLQVPKKDSIWMASYSADAFLAAFMTLVKDPEAKAITVAAAMRPHVSKKDFDCESAANNFIAKWRGHCRLAQELSEEDRNKWVKEVAEVQRYRFRQAGGTC